MPDPNNPDFISGLTGAEIDAAVLMILQKFVASFNGRRGFNILPEKGDYSAGKITTKDVVIPEALQELDFGDNLASLLIQLLQQNVILNQKLSEVQNAMVNLGKDIETVEHVLWRASGMNTTSTSTVYDLNDTVLNYNAIRFYMMHSYNQGLAVTVEPQNLEIYEYSVDFYIKNIIGSSSLATGGLYLFQYSSYYQAVCFPSATQIKCCEINNSSYSTIRMITGVKYPNYTIE